MLTWVSLIKTQMSSQNSSPTTLSYPHYYPPPSSTSSFTDIESRAKFSTLRSIRVIEGDKGTELGLRMHPGRGQRLQSKMSDGTSSQSLSQVSVQNVGHSKGCPGSRVTRPDAWIMIAEGQAGLRGFLLQLAFKKGGGLNESWRGLSVIPAF